MDKFVLVSFQSAVSSDLASKGEGGGGGVRESGSYGKYNIWYAKLS